MADAAHSHRLAVITGGGGVLARAIAAALEDSGRFFEVLSPGHGELQVNDAESVAACFSRLDRVDLLINCAGLTRDAPATRMTEADWDAVIAVNLRGAFLCARAALRTMLRRRGGHIVQIGSFSALRPSTGQANYAAAKAGLIGLTQSLAAEAGKRGVRVNCVLPGFLENTGMTAGLPKAVVERAREAHLLGRFNTPRDAARFIAALDELEAVSGQVFQLDSRLRPHW